MHNQTLTIDSRFNGPPTSGNGGYSCGALAALVPGAAKVRLHTPPPLDTVLRVDQRDDGALGLYEDDRLVASAAPCQIDLDVPPAPSLDQARDASTRFARYQDHVFDTCFVCGPGRPAHDGLELFPGPVTDWSLLACPWTPAADMLDEDGNVLPEIIWSALDCPGYFAVARERLLKALLGELEGEIMHAVPGKDTLIVFSWPVQEEGRKAYAGTAIAQQDGTILARSRSTWITLED